MFTVSVVEAMNVTLLTVILVPEKTTVGVDTKSVPPSVRFSVVFLFAELGVHETMSGGGVAGVFTVNPLVSVSLCVSGFVMVTFLDPGVAPPDMVIFTVNVVDVT